MINMMSYIKWLAMLLFVVAITLIGVKCLFGKLIVNGHTIKVPHCQLLPNEEYKKYILMLDDYDAESRKVAVEYLSSFEDPRYVHLFSSMLYDVDYDVQNAAIIALGRIGTDVAIEVIYDNLIKHRSKSHSVLQQLSAFIFGSYNKHQVSERALRMVKNPPYSAIMKLLATDSSKNKEIALLSFSLMDKLSPDVKALLKIYSNDKSAVIRRAAVHSIGIHLKNDERLLLLFDNYIKDRSPNVRLVAVSHLSKFKNQEYLPLLEYVSKYENDDSIKSKAILAMGKYAQASSFNIIINALQDEKKEVVYAAIEALENYELPEAVEHLKYHANSIDATARYVAIESLKKYRSNDTYIFLLGKVYDVDDIVAEIAIEQLAYYPNDETFRTLISILDSKNIRRKSAAILALGSMRSGWVANTLANMYMDKNDKDRYKLDEKIVNCSIVQALNVIGGARAAFIAQKHLEYAMKQQVICGVPAAIEIMLNFNNTSDSKAFNPGIWKWQVMEVDERLEVIEIVEKMTHEKGYQELLILFPEQNSIIRKRILRSYLHFKATASPKVLIHSLSDPYYPVRVEAYRALKEISGMPYTENNKMWRKWWEENKHKYENLEETSAPDVGTKAPAAAPAE